MKNIRIALTLILTSVSILAFGQRASVKGKVKDAENQGILGASVLLRPTVKGDISDADGTYQIDNIKPGTYTIEVSFLGFENYKQEITLAEGQALALDIELIESPYTLQDVEIVGRIPTEYLPEITYAGTKTGARIKDIPQSIAVLNKEILSDQQIFRISEISDNVAGINLFRPETFTSRGFNVRQDYVNGNRVVLTPDFANPSVTSHYERVEVIKGPAAALFGNSSPGGVINAVTKKPLTTNRASASFTAGSFNTQRATADLTGPLNEKKTLLYRFNVAWEDAESYRDFIHNKNLLVAPSISYLPDDKTRINIDLVNSQSNDIAGVDRGMPVLQGDLFALPISFNSAELFDNRQNTSTLLTISGSRQLTDGISVNVSYSITDFNQNFIETRSSNRFTDDGTELVRNVNDRITNVDSDFVTAYLVAKANTGK
ncbi:MAG: TonB-dependent receptor, partial [Bacteroidota bacterium]